jgi:hypothetical protein
VPVSSSWAPFDLRPALQDRTEDRHLTSQGPVPGSNLSRLCAKLLFLTDRLNQLTKEHRQMSVTAQPVVCEDKKLRSSQLLSKSCYETFIHSVQNERII